jgi:pimeloyl-ACP methyl ester carboxylesterase
MSRRGFIALTAGGYLLCQGSVNSSHNGVRTVPSSTGHLYLRNGRRVAYVEYGNRNASTVVIHHHGQPSCRYEAELFVPALLTRDHVRLISFDRPGIGLSDPSRNSTFSGWAIDLAECVDALRIGHFGISGTSAGTPFSLAAAIHLPNRVTSVSLGCAVAELSRCNDPGAGGKLWRQAAMAPLVARMFFNAAKKKIERNPQAIRSLVEPLTPAERRRFDDPEAVEYAARLVCESLRPGAEAVVSELASLSKPWGLNLSAVRAPVSLFHGDLDRRAPLWMAEYLVRRLPQATLYRTSSDGHLSLPENMAGAILDAVTSS